MTAPEVSLLLATNLFTWAGTVKYLDARRAAEVRQQRARRTMIDLARHDEEAVG